MRWVYLITVILVNTVAIVINLMTVFRRRDSALSMTAIFLVANGIFLTLSLCLLADRLNKVPE